MIAMALCEVGSISERRTAVLVDPKMSGLPAFLVEDSGVNSGLMIPQVTAAALVSENKGLAYPASVDSIPTSAGQEDHVSMAPIAARKACQIARNAAGVVAIELIAAAQGVDCHAPLETSYKLQVGLRKGPRALPLPRLRPLLGRRNRRAPDGGAGGRDRGSGRCSADPRPALGLAEYPDEGAAPDLEAVFADRPDGRDAVEVALGVERPALVGAVAVGP